MGTASSGVPRRRFGSPATPVRAEPNRFEPPAAGSATEPCRSGRQSEPLQAVRTPMRSLVVLLCSLALCSAIPFHKGAHQCPDVCQPEETCCKSNSTLTHGCCPIPQATCCSDGLHCCPSSFKCDLSKNACVLGDLTLPWSPKMEVRLGATITCPGGTHDCPENTTCCQTASGHYGCCPLVKAVCCKDNTHCCPSGFKCDESAGKCRQGNRTLPYLEKFAARPRTGVNKDQVCPDGKSVCPVTSTCCMLTSGKYGCCPMEKAVCCEDKVHCCPNSFTCSATKCKKGEYSIPFFLKTEANIREMLPGKDAKVVTCPDGLSACRDNATCCKDDTGEYGCCPFPQAECCDDQVHCCPTGFTCHTEKGKCSKGGVVIPFMTKTRAEVLSEDVGSIQCEDGSACSNRHTCCKTNTGKYGCCPLEMAVCCKDEIHCCPNGYTCDTAKSRCVKGDMTLPWLEKRPSKSSRKVSKEASLL
ncbi:GRN [Branchiostoma lanceolatum]|uniref:GRN protein n=1 Tax=Branchiostoma lanceolatum TaxID=7740 RepID=A0A8J9VR96_BRALA|nr:GRN [Branchiostoma lanceolatum]